MRRLLKFYFILFGIAVFQLLPVSAVYSETGTVRAKIGIQLKSGDSVRQARSREQINTGDLLRIYIHPEKTAHVYVVHTDYQIATLLNSVQQKFHSLTMVMPSLDEYYQVDGLSPKEAFTIICSPVEIKELLEIFPDGVAPYAQWEKLEKNLTDNSKIDLNEQFDAPFAIAGNVRSVFGEEEKDPFVDRLKIYSGKSMLIKKYEFRVKK